MVDAYQQALRFVLEREGGYSNHPSDTGGATNFGITQGTYAQWRLKNGLNTKPIQSISMNEVSDIYRDEYWTPSRANILPNKLALVHFDWAVNHGVKGAIKTLQRLVATTADGIYGPKTSEAVKQSIKIHGDLALATRYIRLRASAYRSFAHGKQAVFLQGWLNRLAAVEAAIKIV